MPFTFDRSCDACDLSCGQAVLASAPARLEQVRLIVLSDHPGPYECRENRCMVSNDGTRFRNPALPGRRNAGSLIRHLIRQLYQLDDVKQVYYSNAVKCDPRQHTVLSKHLQTCVARWLKRELEELELQLPNTPLLVLGNHAARALSLLDPQVKLGGAAAGRRRLWWVRQHPTVVTFNPALVARSEMRLVTHLNSRGHPARITPWEPPLPGTALHFYIQDLLLLKPYVQTQDPSQGLRPTATAS